MLGSLMVSQPLYVLSAWPHYSSLLHIWISLEDFRVIKDFTAPALPKNTFLQSSFLALWALFGVQNSLREYEFSKSLRQNKTLYLLCPLSKWFWPHNLSSAQNLWPKCVIGLFRVNPGFALVWRLLNQFVNNFTYWYLHIWKGALQRF